MGRVELRKGLETMLLSRVYRKSVLLLGVVLACLLLLPTTAFAQNADQIISADGVGDALLGSTVEELTAALGSGYDVSDEVRITVDFNGHVISRGGEVQFRAAKTEADERLTLFIISNREYQTAEGVGPTSLISAAEAVYGDATLNWNPDNESREFVSFANGPDGRIAFRTPGIGGTNVGIYGQDQLETTEYDPDGSIAAIWVSCVQDDCAASQAAAEPTATPEPTPTPTPTPEPEDEEDPEPEPTPEPTATPAPPAPTPTPAPTDSGGGDATGTDSGQLPRTGATELVLMSIGLLAFAVGGALLLMERRFLCPAWLRASAREDE